MGSESRAVFYTFKMLLKSFKIVRPSFYHPTTLLTYETIIILTLHLLLNKAKIRNTCYHAQQNSGISVQTSVNGVTWFSCCQFFVICSYAHLLSFLSVYCSSEHIPLNKFIPRVLDRTCLVYLCLSKLRVVYVNI